jgi:hypothetical protein
LTLPRGKGVRGVAKVLTLGLLRVDEIFLTGEGASVVERTACDFGGERVRNIVLQGEPGGVKVSFSFSVRVACFLTLVAVGLMKLNFARDAGATVL